MVISSSVHIKNVKPCELETALTYIDMEYSSCKLNKIKDFADELFIAGITDLCFNLGLLWLNIMLICLLPVERGAIVFLFLVTTFFISN